MEKHRYRGYEISIARTPPFFQAAISPINRDLPEIDVTRKPIRATSHLTALALAQSRIGDVLSARALVERI